MSKIYISKQSEDYIMVKKRQQSDHSLMIVSIVAIVAIVVLVTSVSSGGGIGLSTDNLFSDKNNVAGQKSLTSIFTKETISMSKDVNNNKLSPLTNPNTYPPCDQSMIGECDYYRGSTPDCLKINQSFIDNFDSVISPTGYDILLFDVEALSNDGFDRCVRLEENITINFPIVVTGATSYDPPNDFNFYCQNYTIYDNALISYDFSIIRDCRVENSKFAFVLADNSMVIGSSAIEFLDCGFTLFDNSSVQNNSYATSQSPEADKGFWLMDYSSVYDSVAENIGGMGGFGFFAKDNSQIHDSLALNGKASVSGWGQGFKMFDNSILINGTAINNQGVGIMAYGNSRVINSKAINNSWLEPFAGISLKDCAHGENLESYNNSGGGISVESSCANLSGYNTACENTDGIDIHVSSSGDQVSGILIADEYSEILENMDVTICDCTITISECAQESTGSKVICSELNRQGYLSFDDMMASKQFASERLDRYVMVGYHYWAEPLVKVMQRSSKMTQLVLPVGLAWGKHMSYEMGAGSKDDTIGEVISEIGIPESRSLGVWLVENDLAHTKMSDEVIARLADKYLTGLFEGSNEEVKQRIRTSLPKFFREVKEYANR